MVGKVEIPFEKGKAFMQALVQGTLIPRRVRWNHLSRADALSPSDSCASLRQTSLPLQGYLTHKKMPTPLGPP